jgi:hypothetical protein
MYDIFYIAKDKNSKFLDLQKRFPLLKIAKYTDKPIDGIFVSQQKSMSKFFWVIDEDFNINKDFKFDYRVTEWDEEYVHVFKQEDGTYGGLYLIPKKYRITSKEAEYYFFIKRKDIDIVFGSYSPYDKFIIKNPEDYFDAQRNSSTSMFYAISKDYVFNKDFNFKFFIPQWEKKYVHVFKNTNNDYDGVYLIPRNYPITKKEAEYSFFVNNKEVDEIAGKLIPFDIVFISYNESDADENYEKLKLKFPRAKRVHGVKGIHQAHLEAAKISETVMFWVVDGDAIIEDDFDFDIYISKWDRDTVHVFKSKNPINDLTYGYGGVKLLPTKLVLSMDVNSVDMTTSISKKFKSVDKVSNITSFNTDPFNTWKSAFRECVKLSSKVINGQIDNETQHRLDVWKSVGEDRKFGEYAINGAKLGYEFGTMYANEKEMLAKINDWEWLETKFKENTNAKDF